jgi:hypothetical protein
VRLSSRSTLSKPDPATPFCVGRRPESTTTPFRSPRGQHGHLLATVLTIGEKPIV